MNINKPTFKSFFIILFVLMGFISCAKKAETTQASLQIFAGFSAISSLFPGGAMLYGFNETTGDRFGIKVDSTDFNKELVDGQWTFTAIGWARAATPMTGATSCGVTTHLLDKQNSNISMNMNADSCVFSELGGNFSMTGNEFYPLTLVQCDVGTDIPNKNSGSTCVGEKGGVESFIVSLRSYDSDLKDLATGPSLFSSCIEEADSSTGLTTTDIKLPVGLDTLIDYRVELIVFDSAGCAGSHEKVSFQGGLASKLTVPLGSHYKVVEDNSTGSVNLFTSNDFVVSPSPALSFSHYGFLESVANDGSITEMITVTMTNGSFDTSMTATDYSFFNTPAGLTAYVTNVYSNSFDIAFTGVASSHSASDSESNFSLSLSDEAFVGGILAANVIGAESVSLSIDFQDPLIASLAFGGGIFAEGVSNDGSFDQTVVITLSEGSFNTGMTAGTDFIFMNIPSGLTAQLINITETSLELQINGNSINHNASDSISDFSITFQGGAFVSPLILSNVIGASGYNLSIDFND